MLLKEVITELEKKIPTHWQKSYDNCGLLLGNPNQETTKILCSLDCTKNTVSEALKKNCNLIITHHPLIFEPLRKIDFVKSEVLTQLIKSDIALYACHTNLDSYHYGINFVLAKSLELGARQNLGIGSSDLNKIVVFVPESHLQKLTTSLALVGAGQLGLYSDCSFYSKGIGSFKAGFGSNPFTGLKDNLTTVEEVRLEMIFRKDKLTDILKALKDIHPYEEPAFDIIDIKNINPESSTGIVGELNNSYDTKDFLEFLKTKLNLSSIKYNSNSKTTIKKVAINSGAGFFALPEVIAKKADAFITSEVKHHEFLEAPTNLLVCDIGHYESEVCSANLLSEILVSLDIKNIEVSQSMKNPVSYC